MRCFLYDHMRSISLPVTGTDKKWLVNDRGKRKLPYLIGNLVSYHITLLLSVYMTVSLAPWVSASLYCRKVFQ